MSYQKKFATNVFFLIFTNLLVKPFWIFGIDRVVQNQVGENEYGLYFAVFNYSYIFSIVLDFGINTYNNRLISRNPNRLGEYFINLFSLKFILAIVYLLISFISAILIGMNAAFIKLLLILVFNQIILSYILYLRSNFVALHEFKKDTFLSVSDKLIAIFICGYIIYFSSVSITIFSFIYAQTASFVITAIIGFLLLKNKINFSPTWWRAAFFKKILYKSFPYALMALLMSIYYRIDAVIIEKICGSNEVGIYAAAYRMLDAISQFGYLFSVPLLPLFTRMLKNKEAVAPLLFFCHQLMLFFAVSSTAFCFAFSTDFTQLLYHHDDSYHAKIFGSLLLSFVPISFVYVYGTLLLAGGKLKEINAISAIGVVINVVLNILLVKSHAAYGSVIATAITQLMVSASFVYLCYKDFKLPFDMWLYIKNAGFILSIGASLWLLVFYKINFYQAAILYSLGAVLLAFVWQLFSINDLKNKLQLFTKK